MLLSLLTSFTIPTLGCLRAPERLGSLALLNMPNGFAVLKDKQVHSIEPDCVDSTLRNLDYKQRTAYMLKGGGLLLNQADTGEYTLHSVANLKGGGAFGAMIGCWIGKAVVYVGSYAAIGIISVCTGPAAPVTFAALTTAWALPIEAASQAGAIAGGVVGGVATGPV
jgi:hypothetical protein